ncbi:hypothetical protein ABE33_15700 [Bacillus safensis]|uniref:hypothetical protein n=1 Tax=Bacillus TaxID=1386 RepID=UPI0011EB6C3D|nr:MULTISPECIES: hypothetical protein [Bacillus]MBG9820081.1 hypothetical protein [Bacillus safensis]MBG9823602.1 hypothetical protein [Bacillus safensis]MBG9833513.1 hypothetical protein [Bacillus safensis]MBG9862468.1 hypothetical protein [Bacillus safensis]MBG9898395.1 hypothetical protein [Bacillus safensis]
MKLKSQPMSVNLVMMNVQQQLELYVHFQKRKNLMRFFLKPVYADDPFPNGLPRGTQKRTWNG